MRFLNLPGRMLGLNRNSHHPYATAPYIADRLILHRNAISSLTIKDFSPNPKVFSSFDRNAEAAILHQEVKKHGELLVYL